MNYAYEPVNSVPMIRDESITNAVKQSIGRLGFRNLKVHDVRNELKQM